MRENVVLRRDWLHGEARCPSCHLPLDSMTDLEEYEWAPENTRPVAARVIHRRCGTRSRIELVDAPS